MGLVACGDEPVAIPGGDRGPSGDTVAVLEVGPAMLPPDGSSSLDGLSPVEVVDPDRARAEVEEHGGYSPGFAALYADPALDDPFTGRWVLAVLHQGSENSGIAPDAFDPHGTGTTWTDVPVEQLNQERRTAGVLSSGVSDEDLAQLVADSGVSGAESDGRIELTGPGLGTGDELTLVAAGRLDVAELAAGWTEPAPAPSVRWASTSQWSDDPRSLRVTSYAADPELELLLRASIGGAHEGTALIPTYAGGSPGVLGVRTMGATTVLLQGIGLTSGELHGALKALEPVDAAGWADLSEQVGSTPPEPRSANPTVVLSGRVPGGSFTADVQLGTMSVFGSDVVTCDSAIMVRTTTGDMRDGGGSSGECSEHGGLSAMTLEGGGVLFVGELPSAAAAVELVLPDAAWCNQSSSAISVASSPMWKRAPPSRRLRPFAAPMARRSRCSLPATGCGRASPWAAGARAAAGRSSAPADPVEHVRPEQMAVRQRRLIR